MRLEYNFKTLHQIEIEEKNLIVEHQKKVIEILETCIAKMDKALDKIKPDQD